MLNSSEEIIKNDFHNMTLMATPEHNACPNSHKIYEIMRLVDHSLVIIYIYTVCLYEIKEIHQCNTFTSKLSAYGIKITIPCLR